MQPEGYATNNNNLISSSLLDEWEWRKHLEFLDLAIAEWMGPPVGKFYCLPIDFNPDFLIKNLTRSFSIEMLR